MSDGDLDFLDDSGKLEPTIKPSHPSSIPEQSANELEQLVAAEPFESEDEVPSRTQPTRKRSASKKPLVFFSALVASVFLVCILIFGFDGSDDPINDVVMSPEEAASVFSAEPDQMFEQDSFNLAPDATSNNEVSSTVDNDMSSLIVEKLDTLQQTNNYLNDTLGRMKSELSLLKGAIDEVQSSNLMMQSALLDSDGLSESALSKISQAISSEVTTSVMNEIGAKTQNLELLHQIDELREENSSLRDDLLKGASTGHRDVAKYLTNNDFTGKLPFSMKAIVIYNSTPSVIVNNYGEGRSSYNLRTGDFYLGWKVININYDDSSAIFHNFDSGEYAKIWSNASKTSRG